MFELTKDDYLGLNNELVKNYLGDNKVDKERAIDTINNFEKYGIVDEKGIVRWSTNNSIPPYDILGLWEYVGKKFNFDLSYETGRKEDAEFSEAYCKMMENHQYSEEEIREMKNVFGEDGQVMNVFTGKITYLSDF